MSDELLQEVVATGELFKRGHNQKDWNLRKMILSGVFLANYDKKGNKRGQFDVCNCLIKTMTPEECRMPEGP
jgi:hypothetical protein